MQQAILSNFLLHTNNFCLFFKYINFYLNGDWLNEDFVSISKWFINKRKQKKLRKSKQVTKLNISDKGAEIKESSILIYLGCIVGHLFKLLKELFLNLVSFMKMFDLKKSFDLTKF